jgi:hypothetical protein
VRTCRDAVVEAMRNLMRRLGQRDLKLNDIVNEAMAISDYRESTIRTHVVSRMCANAPDNHAVVYADLERVRPGYYRLLHS